MANGKLLKMLLKTITDVQAKNKANPKEQTADPNVFDLLRNKVQQLDEKTKQKRISKGKSPHSILDLIKKEINSVKRSNKKDPNVETAPKSIFDKIMSKVEAKPQRQASASIRSILEEYNLDISNLPREVIGQIQGKYVQDRKQLDKNYAQAIHDTIKKMR